ncbi:hypothetical protein G7Y89_g702 [Cudoniella acicularis]|uniref:RNI-like protein n=1 Tax=Cudoniella acicularis TaxID=354080 RepID=A0A8H4W7P0_9HELO|nr:hypothetical protein G7Y89_g702 [Cudoniella acicularis]
MPPSIFSHLNRGRPLVHTLRNDYRPRQVQLRFMMAEAVSLEAASSEYMNQSNASIHLYSSSAIDEHLAILKCIQKGDFENEQGIEDLPRRRNKSQRPLATQLARALYPSLPEVPALIRYESLVTPAKAIIRQERKHRVAAESRPKNNVGGKMLMVQGPWLGQEVDPVDLKGPAAIPMPVEIGSTENFEPIFSFLAEDIPFSETTTHPSFEPNLDHQNPQKPFQGKRGFELTWGNPLVEFDRGVVYEDGRLDLCKKVVGPIHIGKLMQSLEPNHHVRHFLLGNNAISTTGAKEIADFIRKYPNRMETWYIAGCHITQHGLSLLVPEMINSNAITNLWFKRNPFGPNSASLLAELVLKTRNLRTLDLETTELGDEGTERFINSITGQPSGLRHLYLNANGIGQNACASLSRYLADPSCALISLFLSTNPIGDAGMLLLAPGLAKNKTLKRLTCASTGLTSKGVSYLAAAISDEEHPLQTLDLSASQTTKAHSQNFNYIDDTCIEDLKPLILSPALRWLNLGRTAVTAAGMQEIRSAVARSELVLFGLSRVEKTDVKISTNGKTEVYDGIAAPKSCSLAVRNQLVKNQAKYYPHIEKYDDFLNSEDLRFLRNTSDVRKIDSMYRTRDKRLGLPMDEVWEEGDPTWKLIIEDAEKWKKELEI